MIRTYFIFNCTFNLNLQAAYSNCLDSMRYYNIKELNMLQKLSTICKDKMLRVYIYMSMLVGV